MHLKCNIFKFLNFVNKSKCPLTTDSDWIKERKHTIYKGYYTHIRVYLKFYWCIYDPH